MKGLVWRLRSSFKKSKRWQPLLNSNPPLSPFFKGGIFSVRFSPLFAKEGKGRFSDGMTRELCRELLRQDASSLMQNLFFAVLSLIGLVGAPPNWAMAADKIRISVTNFNMSFLPSGLAVRRGVFKEEGIEAEVIRMNANVAITALASGDTDYTMIFGSVVRAAIRGLPVRVVASLIDGSTTRSSHGRNSNPPGISKERPLAFKPTAPPTRLRQR